ncbi:MAG: polynucleotide adenylyltransferase PcnB [Gammaproteobacteria bacterium]
MDTHPDEPSRLPVIIPRPEHNVSRADISEPALKVLYRLHNSGYQAFLVGGGVRDLLLGLSPKDFDIATDASPEDVRQLFRNCRLIGRRFRLAHVHFGREVIEVATFRASHDEPNAGDNAKKIDDRGRILRDNVYGSIDDDVWRRDFTANSLYYNIADFSILDYTGGVQDVRDRVMRLIGDPATRYREDPVRMLRAVRFAAKLDFTIDAESEAPFTDLGALLEDVPPARLFDETIKLFLAGQAERTYELLQGYGLFQYLFPSCARRLREDDAAPLVAMLDAAMANTDVRVREDRPVTVMFLLAVFLWGPISQVAKRRMADGDRPRHALLEACDEVVRAQQAYVTIPKRILYPIRDMVVMQDRFENRRPSNASRLMGHPRFRAAYDLLVLRAAGGDADQEVADWWTEYQKNPDVAVPKTDGDRPVRKRRRRRRRSRNSGPKPQPES